MDGSRWCSCGMALKRYLHPTRNLGASFLTHVLQVVLETEYDNSAALSLYESLGFIREKRLYRFYLNGKDAFRLVLPVSAPAVLRRNSNNSDTSSINSSSSDDVFDDEDLEWEDVGRLIRLRRNVTQLRAAKFVPVWEREDVERASERV